MFEPSSVPRVFACPPGADFPRHLVTGFVQRLSGNPPEALAHVEVYVNTRRMQRRMVQLFDEGPPLLLPRIRLVTDLAQDPVGADLPPPASDFRRRLDLSRLIRQLLDAQPDLAPRAALFDLADSLAMLLAEMQDEGVTPAAIRKLNVTDSSGYWQRSLLFLDATARYFEVSSRGTPRQRRAQPKSCRANGRPLADAPAATPCDRRRVHRIAGHHSPVDEGGRAAAAGGTRVAGI